MKISAVQLKKSAAWRGVGRFESMPDYAAMYKTLFNSTTDAIRILQEAQQKTEELFISAPEPELRILEPKKPKDNGPDDEGRN